MYKRQVSQQDVPALYKGSLFLVFPSLCENCPRVLIEAMSLGVPIVCSNISVMPEICGDAALYFDPYDIDDIARKIIEVATDDELRCKLRQTALEQSKRFPTWKEVAHDTLQVLGSIGRTPTKSASQQ